MDNREKNTPAQAGSGRYYTIDELLGRAMMEEDGVRQTGFGLVRRLSKPFPNPEIGQTMG